MAETEILDKEQLQDIVRVIMNVMLVTAHSQGDVRRRELTDLLFRFMRTHPYVSEEAITNGVRWWKKPHPASVCSKCGKYLLRSNTRGYCSDFQLCAWRVRTGWRRKSSSEVL